MHRRNVTTALHERQKCTSSHVLQYTYLLYNGDFWRNIGMSIRDILLDLLFPRRSLQGKEGSWITAEEARGLQLLPLLLTEHALRRRGIAYIDHLVAAGKYDSSPLFQKAIRRLKYGRIDALAELLASLMIRSLPGRLPDAHAQGEDAPVVCPVPLHWMRHFSRGFNQSELLARTIAAAQHWPYATLLTRVRATGQQAGRSRADRLIAVRHAFRYCGPAAAPKRVILIDDVLTTGATLQDCARALKAAGVARVEAIVAAYD